MSQYNWTSVGSDFQLKYEYEDESEQYFTTCYQPVNYFSDGFGEFDNSYRSPLPANTIPILNDEDSLGGLEDFTTSFIPNDLSNIDFNMFNDVPFADITNTIAEKTTITSLDNQQNDNILPLQQQQIYPNEDNNTENYYIDENLSQEPARKITKFAKSCPNFATTSKENIYDMYQKNNLKNQSYFKRESFEEPDEYNEDEEQVASFEGDDYLSGEENTDETTSENQPQTSGGFSKPPYSYSCLIGLSLKNSSSGELTVSEIYTFLW